MDTQDPTNLPPSLSAGGTGTPAPAPLSSATAAPPPADAPDLTDHDDDASEVPLKVNYGEKLVEHKFKVLAVLALLFLGGVGLWWYSLTNEMATAAPPSPVAAELGTLTQKPTPEAAREPVDGVEESLDRDRVKETPDEGVMLADGSATAPAGDALPTARQRADYQAQMTLAARANNTDSMTVTTRDRNTGQFVQKRVAVQKVAVGTGEPRRRRSGGTNNSAYIGNTPAQPRYASSGGGGGGGGFSAVTPGNQQTYLASERQQPRERPRPKYDTDGTPFETNDEINIMIANLPDEVKATYEKMSGKRYRPLPASVQQQAASSPKERRAEMAFIPGMDGFNTIRYRGLGSSVGEEDGEEASIPDIFFRCSVQGDQVVKTGTVVVLRLTEDATFNGITFPRNMLFSALASVDANRVNLSIDRLGPHRVKVQTYNYAYMPGIMIDPGKREPVQGGQSFTGGMQQSGTQELSNAIAQSQQAANSLTGVAGRMAVSMIGRIPRAGTKLRVVQLPDGYPMLISKAQTGQGGTGGLRQGGAMTSGGMMGQEGNPFQSLMMSGQGQGGYMGNQGVVPPMYYPADQVRQAGAQAGQAIRSYGPR